MARKSTKIVLAVVISLVAAASACLILLPRLRSIADSKVNEAFASLDESVYSITGLKVDYDYVELSSMDHVALHGIVLYQEDAGPTGQVRRSVISISDMKLKFNIWGILLGKPHELLRQIDLSGLDIAFRLPQDTVPLNKIIKYLFFEPVEYVPAFLLNVDDITFSLVSAAPSASGKAGQPSDSCFITAPHFQTSTLSGAMEFSAPEAQVRGNLDGVFASLDPGIRQFIGSSRISANLRTVSVWVSPDYTQIICNGRLSASAGSISLGEQEVGVRKEGEEIKVEVVGGKGLRVEGEYGLKGGEVKAKVRMEGYRPSEDVKVGEGGVVGEVLGLRYWGEVAVVGGGSKGIGYEGEVRVKGGEGQEVGGVKVGGMELLVKGKGDGEGIKGLEARLGTGMKGLKEVVYRGEVGYEGMEVKGLLGVVGEGGEVWGEVGGVKGRYEYRGGEQGVGGVGVKGFEVKVGMDGGEYAVGVKAGIGGGSIEGAGTVGGGGYEAEAKVEGMEWGEVEGLLRAYGVGVPSAGVVVGDIGGSVKVKGKGEEYAWEGEGLAIGLEVSGVGVEVGGSIRGEGGRYSTEGLSVRVGGEDIGLKGKGAYGGGLSFEGEVGYRGIGYEVAVEYGDGVVKVRGNYGLEAALQIEGGVRGRVKAKGLPVKVGDGEVVGDVDIEGYYEDGGWGIERGEVGVRYEGVEEYPEVRVSGLKGAGGELEAARVEVKGDGYGFTGNLKGNFGDLGVNPHIEAQGRFQNLDGSPGVYDLSLAYADGTIDAKLGLSEFPIETLIKNDAHGSIEASLAAKGTFDYASFDWNKIDLRALPDITFDAKLVKCEYKAMPVVASVTGKISKGVVDLLIPKLEYTGSRVENAKITASLPDGSLGLDCRLMTVLGDKRLEADMRLNGSIRRAAAAAAAESAAGSTSVETAPSALSGLSGSFTLSDYAAEFGGTLQNITYGETLIDACEFSGKYENGNLSFAGGKDAVKFTLKNDGSFEASLGGTLPVAAEARGKLSGDSIDASIDNLAVDLTTLNAFLPDKTIHLDSGRLSGSLTMKGALADPDINGTLSLDSAVLTTGENLVGKIGPVTTSVVFKDNYVVIPDTTAPLGKGSVEFSAQASIDQWTLGNVKLNIGTKEGSELALNRSIGPVNLENVLVRLDLGLTIDDGVLSVGGNIQLERGQLSLNLEDAFSGASAKSTESTESGVSQSGLEYHIAVGLTFGKQLEIYFPDRSIPILHGFMAPTSKLQIGYDSASQYYSLNGQLDFRSGYFFYYLRNFFIKSASLYFNEDSTKFNPLFSLQAELRESGNLGLVKIILSADKTPFNDMHFQLSSEPTMSETQLIALMSGGVLSTDTNQSLGLMETAIASSEFIPQLRFMNTFETKLQRALGLDIVLIRTTFIQRWLMDVTKPLGSAMARDPLARYLDQTSLYVGKYITDSAFLYGNLMFRENPLVSASRLRLDSELGIEFDTPFGLLNWSFMPTYQNGKFNVGQQLSLSWRYVY